MLFRPLYLKVFGDLIALEWSLAFFECLLSSPHHDATLYNSGTGATETP
jgi:hypothetical protein